MAVGAKDSVLSNGPRIVQDRQDQGLSQEALVAAAVPKFAIETLRRAESSKRISREKLGYIAAALGRPVVDYILSSDETKVVWSRTVAIHHFEDEFWELKGLWLSLADALDATYEGIEMHQISPRRMDVKVAGDPGFEVSYIFYDRLSEFEDAMSSIQPTDVIVLDVMSSDRNGLLTSEGFEAAKRIQRLLGPRREVIFFSAAEPFAPTWVKEADHYAFIGKDQHARLITHFMLRVGNFARSLSTLP